MCVWHETHSDDVEKVVVAQRVQDRGNSLAGDGQPQALHAAAHIHQDHHIFRRRRRLNIPSHTHTHTHTHTHPHTHTHRYTHSYTHSHTHIHITVTYSSSCSN